MANVLYEGRRTASYIVSEDVYLSREEVIFQAGAVIVAGTVMGKIKASGKYAPLNLTATDGSEIAAAIAFDNVDVSQSEKRAVITIRHSAVKQSQLIWPEGISDAQLQSAIKALETSTIILR